MSGEADGDAVIVGNFSLVTPLMVGGGPGAQSPQLTITGYIYNKDGVQDVHARIDGMVEVIDRQMKVVAIKSAIARRAAQTEHLESVRQIYGSLAEQKAKGVNLKSQQKQQYEQGQTTIDQAVKAIKKLDAEIEAMQDEVKLK